MDSSTFLERCAIRGRRRGERARWTGAACTVIALVGTALSGQAFAAPAEDSAPAADPIASALAPVTGGLTADDVARRARETSFGVAAKQADLRAAAARVDQAYVAYFPRVSGSATYTRLSSVQSSLGGAIVGALNEGPIFAGPCPFASPAPCALDSKGVPIAATNFSFPAPVNSYSFVASVAVPVSDYLLRLSQAYASAVHAESAKRIEADATALQVGADATIAFYNWLRARGQAVVAREAVTQLKAHLEDARRVLAAGLLSPADIVRIDAQVAAAEQGAAEVQSFVAIAEQQLRTTMHAASDAQLASAVDVAAVEVGNLPPLDSLVRQAMDRRLEIRALDETELSLRKTEEVIAASRYPRLDAFADATYANPNQRIFPAKEEFRFTWDAGLRLSFTLNDALAASAQTREIAARNAGLAEQRSQLRDGLGLEVAAAYHDLQKVPAAMTAGRQAVRAATESLRVRGELFRNGKATNIEILDAQSELTRARLRLLDTQIGALVGQTRLAHATGADAAAFATRATH